MPFRAKDIIFYNYPPTVIGRISRTGNYGISRGDGGDLILFKICPGSPIVLSLCYGAFIRPDTGSTVTVMLCVPAVSITVPRAASWLPALL